MALHTSYRSSVRGGLLLRTQSHPKRRCAISRAAAPTHSQRTQISGAPSEFTWATPAFAAGDEAAVVISAPLWGFYALICDKLTLGAQATAMIEIWQRFKERNKRILAEVIQIQADLAREAPRRSPQILGHQRVTNKTVYFFWALIVSCSIFGWWLLRSGR